MDLILRVVIKQYENDDSQAGLCVENTNRRQIKAIHII